MVEHRAGGLAVEVEIDVVGQIDHRRAVGLGQVGDLELIFVIEIEDRLDSQLARIVLVALLRGERHDYAVGLYAALPDTVGEVFRASMQVVAAVVDLQTVHLTLDLQATKGDAIGIASYALTHGRAVTKVALGGFVAQYHVVHLPLAVGNDDRKDRGSVVRELHRGTLLVTHRVADDALTFGGHAPYLLFDLYHGCMLVLRVLRWRRGCRYASDTPLCR